MGANEGARPPSARARDWRSCLVNEQSFCGVSGAISASVRAVDEVDLRVGNWGWRWVACARSERGRESSGWEETWGGHLRHEDDTVT